MRSTHTNEYITPTLFFASFFSSFLLLSVLSLRTCDPPEVDDDEAAFELDRAAANGSIAGEAKGRR